MPPRHPNLASNKSLSILDTAARDGTYAIPSMCCYNAEGILATVRAAERLRSPAMILLFPWAITHFNSLLVHLASSAARTASVPISVHLDHCQTPEMVQRAADMGGFDSIMVDMSHFEKEENLRLTKELTEYCHERGIATEAEPGRINGGEDGVSDTLDLEGILTTPEEARRFVDTGIDWLAPAFGNVHGEYGPRGIQLEYERLEAIYKEVGSEVRLVLHGADPFDKSIFEKCIGHGVHKINLNKGLNKPWQEVMREKAGRVPLTGLVEEGTERMQEAVERYIELLGSKGKADAKA